MRDFFASPGPMTGDLDGVLAGLTADVAGLAAVGHGLMIHEHLAGAYGVNFDAGDRETVHVRPVPRLLERVLAVSPAPLTTPRPLKLRIAGNCRQFTVLMVAALRARGVPARARCGFGGYFTPGFFEDHWVCEYWTDERWRLVDGQIDDRQLAMFPIDFDVTDVPRAAFLVGGDAWRRYRRGEVSENAFGLTVTAESGAWWIAQNLLRDAAALRKVELLPWDTWGAMPGPGEPIDEELFDRLAEATLDPELAGLPELMADPRLRVPRAVRNAVRDAEEVVLPAAPGRVPS
ncbi:transglutaminase domain-containing protein [Actinophytocola sp.]|uniref:transglutaminase domain-containing protein n=1 Tax=Actinophytocola sp. TaxID=1872138 RepID=UPI00389B20D2